MKTKSTSENEAKGANPRSVEDSPLVKVAAARRVIQRPSELFDAAEGHLLAVKALAFRKHVFDEEDGPVDVAEVAVIDLDGPEPQPLGVLEITWRRIIRQLLVCDLGSWQVGRLVEEPEYHGKELEPPDESVDLGAVAELLGRLHAAKVAQPRQLELGAGSAEPPEVLDDEPPF